MIHYFYVYASSMLHNYETTEDIIGFTIVAWMLRQVSSTVLPVGSVS